MSSPMIVTGAPRTGTSLMMAMLRAEGYTILRDGLNVIEDEFGAYNECEYTLTGIPDTIQPPPNKFIKIVGQGFQHTTQLDQCSHVFVMWRPWRDHVRAIAYERPRVLKKLHEKMKTQIPLEQFIADMAEPHGIAFAMPYVQILSTALRTGTMHKLWVVPLDRVRKDPTSVRLPKGVTLDPDPIRKDKPVRSEDVLDMIEFVPGFFDFLDTLEAALATGNFTRVIGDLDKWGIVMSTHLHATQNKKK